MVGGTDNLIQTLLNSFTVEEVTYNEQVKQIIIEDQEVRIKTSQKEFLAQKVICCVPPALLVNSVQFTPELPELFLNEARKTHTWMQESIKAGVVYSTPFWKAKKLSAILSNHGPVIEFYDHSDAQNSKFALCGFIHPDYLNYKKEEREKRILHQLKRLLGKEAGEYIGYSEVVWQKENFTTAPTEKIFLPHQNSGNKIFQEPLYGGKVLVSNSETSGEYGGYMEGAVFSANLIAKKLAEE